MFLIDQGGRQVLLDAALEAIKVAENSLSEGNRVLKARSYHTATVYLEVLSSFNALSPGELTAFDGQTNLCRWSGCKVSCFFLVR